MRTPFIAGNWKMNKNVSEAVELVEALKNKIKDINNVESGVCPPAVDLYPVKEAIKNSSLKLGAQNVHWEESGAYTGETSVAMLQEIGLDYVIIGHSERREYFGETDLFVNLKVKAALAGGIRPIICVGETLEERKKGETENKVELQVRAALTGLEESKVKEVVIAYEPIWAIGTGESATATQAEEVIKYIRKIIADDFGKVAEEIRIQYGGSVKPDNVVEFMSLDNIDGALVGGASLTAESFAEIIEKTSEIY